MNENMRPVSLSPACVRTIFAGRKTQMRLIQKDSKWDPGELVWVREPWCTNPPLSATPPDESFLPSHELQILYKADTVGNEPPNRGEVAWYPGKTMPRWASRLTLRVEGVRAENLQEINKDDLVREGRMWVESGLAKPGESERDGFARWWDSVHSLPQEQWERNPAVWVISFRPVQ
jgi:hypothetical protein